MTEHVRDLLYREVEAERLRQEWKWGIQHHGRFEWASILGEEYGEVCQAGNEGDIAQQRKELIECAAVCLAWAEDIDMGPRQKFMGKFGYRETKL